MRLGQEFKFRGKKFAFQGYNKQGKIQMKDLATNSNRVFSQVMDESLFEILDTINEEVVQQKEQEKTNELKAIRVARMMEKNQKFLGQDGMIYIFVKANKKRFEFRNEKGSYTNAFAFIQKPLNEFASPIEEINIHTLKYGQVFIGNDGNKYVFEKANRTKFVFVDYKRGTNQYDASPQFIKELVDEIKLTMITFTLYGETKEMEYKKCLEFLKDCMDHSEGNEFKRYFKCYQELMQGKTTISDDIDY